MPTLVELDVDLGTDGVFHLAGFGFVALEGVELVVEVPAEQADLFDESLHSIGDDGLFDQPAHLVAAVGDVEGVVAVGGAGGLAYLAEPAQVVRLLHRLGVGEHHVHALRNAAKRRLELRAHVFRFEYGDARLEVVLVLDPGKAAQRRGVPRLQSRELVPLGLHRAFDVAGAEDGKRFLQRLPDAPVVDNQGRSPSCRRCGSRGRWLGATCAPSAVSPGT